MPLAARPVITRGVAGSGAGSRTGSAARRTARGGAPAERSGSSGARDSSAALAAGSGSSDGGESTAVRDAAPRAAATAASPSHRRRSTPAAPLAEEVGREVRSGDRSSAWPFRSDLLFERRTSAPLRGPGGHIPRYLAGPDLPVTANLNHRRR